MKTKFDDIWKDAYEKRAKLDMDIYEKSYESQASTMRRAKLLFKLLDNKVKKTDLFCLDAGCGHGEYCRMLSAKGNKVIGLDYSGEMLKLAKKMSEKDIGYIQGNLYDLPFDDNSFDVVLNFAALQCVEDYEKAVNELCRVTKKSGFLFIITLRQPSKIDLLYKSILLLFNPCFPPKTKTNPL